MNYDLGHIAQIVNGKLLQPDTEGSRVRYLSFDSRQIAHSSHTLFLCIKGRRLDGHDFIGSAYKKGIRHFMVSTPVDTDEHIGATFLQVDNVLNALQTWATYHRRQYGTKVIGITGSNGKTTVKEWLFQMLAQDINVVKSPKSYNSQLGVPLSVLQIDADHQLALIEVGISRSGEMEKLQSIVQPTIGILTHLGPAHDEGFDSTEEKLKEKSRLFEGSEKLIGSCNWVRQGLDLTLNSDTFPLCWSESVDSPLRIRSLLAGTEGTEIHAEWKGEAIQFDVPFVQRSDISNALHCITLMLEMGYEPSAINVRLMRLTRLPMRLEVKAGINNCLIIDDSYNSDIHSIQVAFQTAAQYEDYDKKSLFITDVEESRSDDLYQTIADLIAETGFYRVFAIGDDVRQLKSHLPDHIVVHVFSDTEGLIKALPRHVFSSELLLLKGARRFELERVLRHLRHRSNQSVLEIDLGALEHNYAEYRNLIDPSVKIMAMVKAFAYGSGIEVFKWLVGKGIDYLCVAYPDEGAEIRRLGIELPIMVMNSTSDAFEQMLEYDLEPEIYSVAMLNELIRFLQWKNAVMRIHLKVETGMHRLGLDKDDLASILDKLSDGHVHIASVFTHLVAAEDPDEQAFSRRQYDRFQAGYELICAQLDYRPLRHVVNSAGIVAHPELHADMVRLGIGMYGVDPTDRIQDRLLPALTLKGKISQIKTVRPEDTIGYNRKGRLDNGGRIATISVGYADGLPRIAGNGAYALWLYGKAAPILGNVCMDMCMIDVSHIPEVQVGDDVEIFGKHRAISDLAAIAGTIPYEIYTNVPERVRRVYVYE